MYTKEEAERLKLALAEGSEQTNGEKHDNSGVAGI